MVSRKMQIALFAVLLLSLASLLFALFFYFFHAKVIERNTYYSQIEIGPFLGVDVNSTAFIFGAIPPGSKSRRSIILNNTYDFPVLAKIVPLGDMAKFLDYQEVVVEGKSARTVSLEAVASEGTPSGVYEGAIEVVLVKAVRR